MELHSIVKRTKRVMPGKRIGRGYGSGVGGHTSTRGQKGQKSRTGHKSLVFFEGGNVPFYKRIPKYRGFKNLSRVEFAPVNVSQLNDVYKAGDTVNVQSLKEKGLIRKRVDNVKLLGYGELKIKVDVEGLAVSKSAKKQIEALKGSVK